MGTTDDANMATATTSPKFSIVDGSVQIEGVSAQNPIIYDNDWWFDVFDNNYLWAQVHLGKADLRGNIVSRDMWDWQTGYQYSMNQSLEDADKALAKARSAGLLHIPDWTRGSDRALERPASGHIEDTVAYPSDGSQLIVAEARKATPEHPLLVIAGGPLTTVANALLSHPEIALNMIVFNLTVSGGYNGKDGWSVYIVTQRTRYVDWGGGQFWDRDSVFRAGHFDVLPDNPFTAEMKEFIRTDLGRANQLGDGAALVWLNQPRCWRNAEIHRSEFHDPFVRFVPIAEGEPGDVLIIPKSATDLQASREEFFRILTHPDLFP